MAKFSNNNKPNNNKPRNNSRSKPIMKSLPVRMSGVMNNDRKYDINSLADMLQDLQDHSVFTKLSVPVVMSKALCTGKADATGIMTVARVQSYDRDVNEMCVIFFDKNKNCADMVDDMSIVPRVRTGRDSDEVTTILGFEIME